MELFFAGRGGQLVNRRLELMWHERPKKLLVHEVLWSTITVSIAPVQGLRESQD